MMVWQVPTINLIENSKFKNMNKLIRKLRKAFAIPCVISSAKPKVKTLEERVEILEKLCDMYYKELYTHYTDDICMKGEMISKIDRLEKHCL